MVHASYLLDVVQFNLMCRTVYQDQCFCFKSQMREITKEILISKNNNWQNQMQR